MNSKIPVDSLTTAKLKLSMPVNGVFVLMKDIAESLQRFCRPITFYNDDEHFDLSFSGSGLLLNDRGRRMVLCSRHQLSKHGREPSELVIIVDDGNGGLKGLTPDGAVSSVLDPAEDPDLADATDIFLAEYASVRPGLELSPQFLALDLSKTADLNSVPEPDIMFAIGYPAQDRDYDPVFNADFKVVATKIVSRWTKIYLRPAKRTVWDFAALIPLLPASDDVLILDNPDGMSGSPVFFVYDLENHNPTLGFAGILVRGNECGRHNLLPASLILQMIDQSA